MTSLAMRLYQSGASREQAIQAGVQYEFDHLVQRYRDASIPVHMLVGFIPTKPYSCDYHTGGAAGALLQQICKERRQ